FFTGNHTAGENFGSILKKRDVDLPPPNVMCDASNNNIPKDLDINLVIGNCLDHARRKYIDVMPKYKEESLHILTELSKIYGYDRMARYYKLSPTERLSYHHANSKPILDGLKAWI